MKREEEHMISTEENTEECIRQKRERRPNIHGKMRANET